MHHTWVVFSGITRAKVQRQNRIGGRRSMGKMELWEVPGDDTRYMCDDGKVRT